MLLAVSSGLIIAIVVIAIVVLLVIALVGMYNGLVQKRNRAENAWAQVDVQLKRRHDLIPNLVETVKGYAAARARDVRRGHRSADRRAAGAGPRRPRRQAENMLTQALGRLFAVAEAYPQLRATENFQQLQAQLSETESNIAISRQVYNDTVLTYDNALETVPTSIIAGIFNFRPREYFQTDEARPRRAPGVVRQKHAAAGGAVTPSRVLSTRSLSSSSSPLRGSRARRRAAARPSRTRSRRRTWPCGSRRTARCSSREHISFSFDGPFTRRLPGHPAPERRVDRPDPRLRGTAQPYRPAANTKLGSSDTPGSSASSELGRQDAHRLALPGARRAAHVHDHATASAGSRSPTTTSST